MAMDAALDCQSFPEIEEVAFGRTPGNLRYGNGKGTVARVSVKWLVCDVQEFKGGKQAIRLCGTPSLYRISGSQCGQLSPDLGNPPHYSADFNIMRVRMG